MTYEPDMVSAAMKMVGALAVVLFIVFAVMFYVKRAFGRYASKGGSDTVRVLGSTFLGVKKTVSLVEIPGAVLVLGVSNDRITLLATIDDGEVLERMRTHDGNRPAGGFSKHLSQAVSRLKNGKNTP